MSDQSHLDAILTAQAPPAPERKMFYRPSEVGKMFNVTAETVRSWIKNGDIVASRINNRFMIPFEALQAFVERQRVDVEPIDGPSGAAEFLEDDRARLA